VTGTLCSQDSYVGSVVNVIVTLILKEWKSKYIVRMFQLELYLQANHSSSELLQNELLEPSLMAILAQTSPSQC